MILCESCKHDIIDEPYEGCLVCHAPCGPRGVCASCRRHVPLEQAWCVGERREALKRLGDDYKFDNRRAAAEALATLLDARLPVLDASTVIVPIPTSAASVRRRGFDHTGLIARRLAARRTLKIAQPLERVSAQTLHFLSRAEREKIGPFLFAAKEGVAPPQHVLLLDDIITTGTTLCAAARLLKDLGVKRIDAAVVARQPFD